MDMPAAIRAVTERRDLSAAEMTEVMRADHDRRRHRGADRRLPDRAAHEGRDRGGDCRRRPGDARTGQPGRGGGRASGGYLRYRRRCARHLQRLHRCAFVVAAAGAQVAKHGNRSVSSRSGSADVLEAAGVNLDLTPAQVVQCVDRLGVGFMFAPLHHGAMKHAIGPRREMGVRTIFNLLGPLTNPAGAPNQLIGVFSAHWLEPLAEVLARLGSRHVLVVHGEDGLDEISIGAATQVAELKDGKVQRYALNPERFGLQRTALDALVVKDAGESLAILQAVLADTPGAARDIVLLNAGAAIYVAGLADSMERGWTRRAR